MRCSVLPFELIRCFAQPLKSVTLRLELRELVAEFVRDCLASLAFCVELVLKDFYHSFFLLEGLPYQAVQANVSIGAPV